MDDRNKPYPRHPVYLDAFEIGFIERILSDIHKDDESYMKARSIVSFLEARFKQNNKCPDTEHNYFAPRVTSASALRGEIPIRPGELILLACTKCGCVIPLLYSTLVQAAKKNEPIDSGEAYRPQNSTHAPSEQKTD